MLIALPLAIALVAALAWRHRSTSRSMLLVGAFALGLRLAAALVIYLISLQAGDTGEWLSDESAFFKATRSLLPDPFNQALPLGLDHLGGDGYLGLTTALALAGGGVVDANAFRVINAGLGSAVVVVSMLVARRLFGERPALLGGLVLAVWPTLVLWSATMLRDTLGSFAIVALWWMLGRARWPFLLGAAFLSLGILLSLRPYVGGAVAAAVLAWTAYPLLRNRRVALGVGAVAVGLAVLVIQTSAFQTATRQLFYLQTVTRVEKLGRLYTDQPEPAPGVPFKPGEPVAVRLGNGDWLLGGVVQRVDGANQFRVTLTDASERDVSSSELVSLQDAQVPPLEMVATLAPNLQRYLTGSTSPPETDSLVWIPVALGWDLLATLAILAVVRRRVAAREWLFPACVVGVTILALTAVPGAAGNADRHRATQTVPFLAVFASGLLAGRSRGAAAQPNWTPESATALTGASASSRNQSSSISSAQM